MPRRRAVPEPESEPEPPRGPGKSRKSMELVRALYTRMSIVNRVYRFAAVVLLLATLGLGARLVIVSRRDAANRRQAAELFYQLRALDLAVARLVATAPERRGYLERRQALQALYDEWTRRIGETSTGDAAEQAIRAAIARLGEARVLADDRFIGDVRRKVDEWRRTPTYANALRTATALGYPAMIANALDSAGLPTDLAWVAFQESRFRPRAVGPPTRYGAAKGMWQLLPATARQYGLHLGPLVGQDKYDPADQRHDAVLSTTAAIRYMNDLYLLDAQGSGLLVMACYNAGQTRMLALVRSLPLSPRERNFWRLLERHRKEIPDETYGYVVGIVAAAAVAQAPAVFGFDPAVIPPI